MLQIILGQQFYADATHPGWGAIRRAPGMYDQATGAIYTEVALSGLSKNIALIGTARAFGSIGRTYSNYYLSDVRMAVSDLNHTAAYDNAEYAYVEPVITWAAATALSSWTAAEVALSGLSKNIALGGPGFGAWQKSRTLALKKSVVRYFTVEGEVVLTINLPAPQGFAVIGSVGLAFVKIAGTVQLAGAFSCAGNLSAQFSPSANTNFTVAGEVRVGFYPGDGQKATCITGPGVPVADGGAPANAAY
jgi:hypothetical protein